MDSGSAGCLINTLAFLFTAVIVLAGVSLLFRIFIYFLPTIVLVLCIGGIIYLGCNLVALLSR